MNNFKHMSELVGGVMVAVIILSIAIMFYTITDALDDVAPKEAKPTIQQANKMMYLTMCLLLAIPSTAIFTLLLQPGGGCG